MNCYSSYELKQREEEEARYRLFCALGLIMFAFVAGYWIGHGTGFRDKRAVVAGNKLGDYLTQQAAAIGTEHRGFADSTAPLEVQQ